ncbi:hypothetical protein STRIP9103_01810 [Streptomyces ipomoeae 91-03]|uniref:Uncharacterized protein n=1 Tax=Streptomyces ipomoeae 91-03 TaxID=698759 RepID=L1L786_9ACTN|nr:hypothetical protein STRIP9103_01810 [Streptomyces ipomoeae 91-03]
MSLRVVLGGGEHAAEPGHGGGGLRQTARGPLYRGGPVDPAELIADRHQRGAVDGFHPAPSSRAVTWSGSSTGRWRRFSTVACSAPSLRAARSGERLGLDHRVDGYAVPGRGVMTRGTS